jgi:hypothetical protein
MKCRWCDEDAIKFESASLVAREWKGTKNELPDDWGAKGIYYCVDHLYRFSVPRQIGMLAAIRYLKKRGKI